MNVLCRLPDRDFDENIVLEKGTAGRQCATGGAHLRCSTTTTTNHPSGPSARGDKSPRPSEQTVRVHTVAQHLELGMLAETGKQYMHG